MRFLTVLTLGLLAAGSAVAQTPQEALMQVPEEALGCLLVNRIEATSGKFDVAAKRMKIEVPMTMLEALRMGLGGDKGINLKGSALAVIMPGGQAGVTAVILAPVADYAAFTSAIGAKKEGNLDSADMMIGKVYLAKRGSFAAIAKADDKALLVKFLATKVGNAAQCLPMQPWAAPCVMAGVALKPAIRLGLSQADKLLKDSENAKFPDPSVEEVMGVYRMIGAKILDAVATDIPFLAVVGAIDTTGNIDVSIRAPFAKNSASAKAFAGATSPTEPLLAGLPDVPFVMAMGATFPTDSSEAFAKLSSLFLAAVTKNLTADQKKQLEDTNRETAKQIKSFSFVMGVGNGNEPMFHSVFAAYRVEDSAKLLAQMFKSADLTKQMMKNLKVAGADGEVEINKLTIAGKPAMSMVTDFAGFDDPNNPFAQKMKEIYFGPTGKMTVTMVATDKSTVFARYTQPAEAEEYIKNRLKPGAIGLEGNKDVQKTVMLLPKGTQFSMLADIGGFLKFTNRLMDVMVPPGQPKIVMPEAPVAPPVGIGAKITTEGAALHIVLPAATQDSIGRLVDRFKAICQQGHPGRSDVNPLTNGEAQG